MTAQSQTDTSFISDFNSAQIEAGLINFLAALTQQNCSNATVRNYRSDIRQFYKFMEIDELEDLFTLESLKDFVIAQRSKGLKDSSITRKIASITQFALWSKDQGLIDQEVEWMDETSIESLLNPPLEKKAPAKFALPRLFQAKNTQPITETNLSDPKLVSQFAAQVKPVTKRNLSSTASLILPYLNLGLMVLFFIGLGFLGYNQLIKETPISFAYPSTPTRADRVLSFQGRLTDTAQNPITVATNMEFKIWDQLSGGTEGSCDGTNDCEYQTSVCSVTPDQDGIFNVGIGDDCGLEIGDAVFTENSALWLEVKIGTETLTPRQPIRTVPFAVNSETVQGYPITSTQAATVNTILVMDGGGNVTLGENNPTLRSSSGTFTISGGTLSLEATSDILFSDARITDLPLSLVDTQIDPALSQGVVDAINDVYALSNSSSFFDQSSNLIYPNEYWADEFALGGNSTGSADIWLGKDGGAVFNEQGNNVDFRVESDTKTHALFIQGSSGNVGIGKSSPGTNATLDILGNGLRLDTTGGNNNVQFEVTDGTSYFGLQNFGGDTQIGSNGDLVFKAGKTGAIGASIGGTESLRIDDIGNLTFNETSADIDFRVEGNNDQNLFFTDASTDRIGIGTNSPTGKLQIQGDLIITATDSANYHTKEYVQTRSVGTTAGDTVNIGDITFSSGAGTIEIDLVSHASGHSIAGKYILPVQYANQDQAQNNVWLKAQPISFTGDYNTENIELDIKVNNGVASLRIRRVAGTVAAMQIINLRTTGGTASFAANAITGTDTAPTLNYGSAMITQRAGKLGVGTTNPSYTIDINGDINFTGELNIAGNQGTSGQLLVSGGNGVAPAWTSPSSLSIGNADTLDSLDSLQFLRSDTTDEFTSGILSINAAADFDVNGDLLIADTDIAFDGASTNFTTTGNFSINTNDLFIEQATGEIGIGTTDPSARFHVVKNSGVIPTLASAVSALFSNNNSTVTNNYVTLISGTAASSRIQFGDDDYATNGEIGYDNVNNYLALRTNDLNRMVIASTGEVGIGDTTPDHKLDVAGNIGLDASGYINWGDVDGTSGYGFRDSSGTLQFKNSSGAWTDLGVAANTYWDLLNGTLTPKYTTTDVNIGGNSSASAKVSLAGSLTRGRAAVIINQTENQDILSASASGVTKFTINNSGNLILANSEYISNSTDDNIVFGGAGGSINTDLTVDLDGNNPVLFSTAGLGIEINDRLYIGTNNRYFYDDTAELRFSDDFRVDSSLSVGSIASTGNSGELITGSNVIISDQGDIRLKEAVGSGNNYTGFQAPTTLSSDLIYTLPDSFGSLGYVLTTDGAGGLTWNTNDSNNYWQQTQGMLSPSILSLGLNIGATATTSAKVSIAGSLDRGMAALIVNQTENQDIFAASASGVTKFKIDNTGNLGLVAGSYVNWGLPLGTSGYGFRDNGGTLQFKNSGGAWADFGSGGGAGDGFWSLSAGAISPYFLTTDVNFGDTATDSAKVSIASSLTRGKSALIVNQTEAQDIFTASKSGVTRFVINSDGDVGIGTKTPAYKLQIHDAAQSDMAITTDANVGAGNTTSLNFVSDQDGTPTYSAIGQFNTGDLKFSAIGNLVSPDLTLSATTGNLGIGDTSPASLLTVGSGDLFQVNSSGSIVSIGGVAHTLSNVSGDLQIDSVGGQINFANNDVFNIGGSTGVAYNSVSNTATADVATDDNDLFVEGFLEVDGNLNLAASSYFNWGDVDGTSGYGIRDSGGTLQFKHSSGNWVDMGLASNAYWQLNNGSLSPFALGADINLGATATSSAKISLAGSLNRGKAAVIINQTENQDIFAASASGVTKFAIDYNGNATLSGTLKLNNQLQLANFNSDPTAMGEGALYYNTSSDLIYVYDGTTWNSVGGTSTNYWQLNNGSLSPFALGTDINLGATATSSAKVSLAGSLTRGKAAVIINQTENQDIFAASASGITKFKIENDGDVYLTQLLGTSYNPYNNIDFIDSGIGINSYLNFKIDLDDDNTDSSESFTIRTNAGTSELFRVNWNGNTGIGDTTPEAKLDVEGAVTGQALVQFNQTGNQDIIAASVSGVNRFKVDNNGYVYSQRFIDLANSNYYLDPAATDISLTTAGKIGAGTDAPEATLHAEGNAQFGSNSMTDISVNVYGNVFQMGDTKINNNLTNIQGSYLYDTTRDNDGGSWRKSTLAKTLSYYTESRDDGFLDSCNPSTDDRCGTSYFPAKANIIYTDDAVYIFDVSTNTMWMKFSQGTGNAIGSSANSTITSAHGHDGRVWIGTRGSASDTGLYEIDFRSDTVYYYDITDRSESNQTISGRNGGSNTFSTNNQTAFAISNTNVNDIDSQYNKGALYLAVATDSGINLIDTSYIPEYEYFDVASNGNTADTITDDGNGGANDAIYAFDSLQSTYARSDTADNVFTLTYQFGTATAVNRYVMEVLDATYNTQAPEDWTFSASNTGAFAGEETVLDTATNITFGNLGSGTEEGFYIKDINPTNTAYTYYRLYVTDPKSAAADQVDFSELRFLSRRQKPAVRLYSENLMGNYQNDASSANTGTTYSPRRATDWSRMAARGEFQTQSGNTKPWLRTTLRQPKVITQYLVGYSNTSTYSPTGWTMEGTNDGVNWTVLDTQTGQTFAAYQNKTYTFSNSTAYKSYRLNVTTINGATDYAEIGEFQVGVPVITASTSNNNTSHDETNLIFQDQADTVYYWISASGGVVGAWVKYDYGSGNAFVANSYGVRGYQPTLPARAMKNWRFQGSNDNTNWTTLDTQTNQTFADDYLTLKTYEFSNSTAYRYYRIYVDANNGDASYVSLRGFYVFGGEERTIADTVYNGTTYKDHSIADEDDFGYFASKTTSATGWIEKQFAPGQAATISGLIVQSLTSSTIYDPRDWTFYGSNDRVTWTQLKKANHASAIVNGQSTGFTFGNNTAYQFYRFKVDAVYNAAYWAMQELRLMGGQYNNVRFVDNALVGTNATMGQVEIFQNLWDEEEWDASTVHDLRFTKTGANTVDLDIALSANPSGSHTSSTGNNYYPALSGSIGPTKYGLEADGSEILIGHANGVDRIYSAPNPDAEGQEARARIAGTYNNSRIIANRYGFDHYWPMDEGPSATAINDYGNAGGSSDTFGVGAYLSTPTSTASGKIGRAYAFDDASNQYISIKDRLIEDSDSAGGDYTYGGWMYLNAEYYTVAQGVMGDYYAESTCGTGAQTCRYGTYFGIRANSNTLYVGHCPGTADVACTLVESKYQLPFERWVNFVVQRRNNDVSFYFNGELFDTYTNSALPVDGTSFLIGAFGPSSTASTFDGRLDEIFIKYGENLTKQQIREIYQDGVVEKKAGGDTLISDGSSERSVSVINATTYSSTTIGDSSLNLVPNFYQGLILEITGGTGAGQTRLISKHTATTFTVSPAWSTTPDSTSDFEITPYALPGSINSSTAIRADQNDIFIGLSNDSDGGGVVRIDRDSQKVVDYYHGNAGKTDDHSGNWDTTSGYDDVVGISTTQDNLMISSQSQYWHEKIGDSLWEIIDKLQQGFSAGIIDTHTQEYDGANLRNSTKTVLRKGWSYITSNDTYKTVYYGISYNEPPIVVETPAGIFYGNNTGDPASLESCANLTATADDLSIAAINKDNFILAEVAGNTQQCFTWIALGDYSGSMPDGSFATGADLAEWYGTEDVSLTAGEVVSIAPSADIRVSRSTGAKDHTAIGVIATQPSITIGPKSGLTPGYSADPQLTKGAKTAVQVALAGRVPVKVSLENGKIKAGDFLTTSTRPGYAAKAITAGPTIGQALEDFDGSNTVVSIIDPNVTPDKNILQDYSDGMTNTKVATSSGDLEINSATPSALVLATAEPIEILDQDMIELKNGFGTIMVFVNTGYGDPEAEFTYDQETGKATVEENIAKLIPDFAKEFIENLKTTTKDVQIFVSERVEIFSKIFARIILSQEVKTDIISPISSNGDLTIQLGEDRVATESGVVSSSKLVIKNASGSAVTTLDNKGNLSTLGEIEASTISAQTASISGEVNATSARLQKIESKLAQIEHINAQTAEIVNATISGTLFAENIDDFENKIANAIKQPTLLEKIMGSTKQNKIETNLTSSLEKSDFIKDFDASSTSRLSLDDLILSEDDLVINATAVFINQYLDINGSAYIAEKLGLGQSLTIADSMHITAGNISYEPTGIDKPTLSIQPSGKGLLSLMGGIFSIDESGEIKANGNLSVSGNLNVEGTLLANLIKLNNFDNPFQVQLATISGEVLGVKESRFEIINELGTPVATISAQGKAEFAAGLGIGSENLEAASDSATIESEKTSGTATIKSNSSEIVIKSKIVTDKSLIYLTPLGTTDNQVFYVKEVTLDNPDTTEIESGFKVGFDNNLKSDLRFNWWIVN